MANCESTRNNFFSDEVALKLDKFSSTLEYHVMRHVNCTYIAMKQKWLSLKTDAEVSEKILKPSNCTLPGTGDGWLLQYRTCPS